MAVLLVFGGVSKDFVHLFTGHEDTVHCNDKDGILHFESEHHHCDFLSFTLTPFAQDAVDYFIPASIALPEQHTASLVQHLIPRGVIATRQRGPPVFVA